MIDVTNHQMPVPRCDINVGLQL